MDAGRLAFKDRADAGKQLAGKLSHLRGRDVVVLGLPRGGVPVAFPVAEALRAPLDVIIVRKLRVPDQPELGMGALGEGGVRVLNPQVVRDAHVCDTDVATVEAAESATLTRQARRLRGSLPAADLAGRTAVIVDDGIATGSTARAACRVAQARGAAHVVVAVPVAPADLIEPLRRAADDVTCVRTPDVLSSISRWYEDFTPTTDDEVHDLLADAATRQTPADRDEEVTIRSGTPHLPGHLHLPPDPTGLVVFVHGSGSSRHSPRNKHVAALLNQAGLGTLLFDLLTPDEEQDRANVFDIALLATRLADATAWTREQPWAENLHIGWFGASTGAGAALWAAAEPNADVTAIVSRGGRPDLAGPRLPAVTAPTQLIVGARDTQVLALNRAARTQLTCPNELVVVPGATHLFHEPGTLTTAAHHARTWFTRHLHAT